MAAKLDQMLKSVHYGDSEKQPGTPSDSGVEAHCQDA